LKSESFVSVVLVANRPAPALVAAIARVQSELDELYSDYEIVLIAQGPVDPTAPPGIDDALLASLPSVRYIQLATRVGDDVAWAAGLENAIGDFVVLFDYRADPVAAIRGVVDVCKSGFDVVVGVTLQPKTLPYRLFRGFATALLRAVDYRLPANASSLRCLSRRAVYAVTRTGRFHHQFDMRIQKTGFPSCIFSYVREHSASPKKTLAGGVRNFLRLLVFNSSRPLRWTSMLGFTGSFAAFLFGLYSILIHFIKGNVVEGWTTTILFMSSLFMVQFVMLALFGEYLGRLLDDRSEQADYSVVFEKTSAVMVNQNRVNVLNDSTSLDVNRVQTARGG